MSGTRKIFSSKTGASKLALTREFGNAKLASLVKASFDAPTLGRCVALVSGLEAQNHCVKRQGDGEAVGRIRFSPLDSTRRPASPVPDDSAL